MLQIGDHAPEFTLKDDQGRDVSLKKFRGTTVVLYFYPKDDTPGCTREACDFRDNYQAFRKNNAVILGVSRDPAASHAKFKEKYQLPFPLLADEDGAVCQQYGVWVQKTNYGKTYWGIERSTFVIDGQSRIQEIIRKVQVDGHAASLLTKAGRTTAAPSP